MARKRTATKLKTPPWPEWWTVEFTWEFEGKTLKSREWMVQIKGSRQWHIFNRYVKNNRNGAEWIDAFSTKPYGAFISFRPDQITTAKKVDKRAIDRANAPTRKSRQRTSDK